MKRIGKLIFILGCLLIAASFALLLLLRLQTRQAERANTEMVQTIEGIFPDRREGAIDPDRDAEMPALEIQGEDYIALLEIPAYGLKLPVGSIWDKGTVRLHPCRFSGSAYDGTLVVGGYDQPGQFAFFDSIQPGAAVTLTDMTGTTFSYTLEQVERRSSAETEILMDSGAELTLFVRDARLLEYIILRCAAR